MRLLRLALPEDGHFSLPPEPKKPSRWWFALTTGCGLALTAGAAASYQAWDPTRGTVDALVLFAVFGLLVGPSLLIGVLLVPLRPFFERIGIHEGPRPTKPEWTLADVLTYGNLPGSPPPGAVYSYRDPVKYVRHIRREAAGLIGVAAVFGLGALMLCLTALPSNEVECVIAGSELIVLMLSATIVSMAQARAIAKFVDTVDCSLEPAEDDVFVLRGGRRIETEDVKLNVRSSPFASMSCPLTARCEGFALHFDLTWMTAEP